TPSSGKMLREALQQWAVTKNIKREHKKYMIGLRRRRKLEGKATVIQYSVLSPEHVTKQLDRFIAENEVHEHEQIEWESLASREFLTIVLLENLKLIQRIQLYPRRLFIIRLKNLKILRVRGRKA